MASLSEFVQQSRQRGSVSPSAGFGQPLQTGLAQRAEKLKAQTFGANRQQEFDTLFAEQQAGFEDQTRQTNLSNIIKSLSSIEPDKLQFLDLGEQFKDISSLGLSGQELQRGIGQGFNVFQDESGIAHAIEVGSIFDRARAGGRDFFPSLAGATKSRDIFRTLESGNLQRESERFSERGLSRVNRPEVSTITEATPETEIEQPLGLASRIQSLRSRFGG